ncbi:GGDEF domain-containing protein [Pectobacterium carotovorum subsp. carotovorum]|uniref:GGDEF domain-containing protein n=1 Tax=Pectobacterium carotovorum TaxID=554 RepID=UPI00202D316B|nr:GGDEF domain-containing protein [Pectobacterium carotovorum]MCL6329376.1 GGDEF domain-containing protein [Pectobacterium carotovorum subsp. carotovorum]
MTDLKYKILKLFSHPTSAFFLFGFISFFIVILLTHEASRNAWKVERQNLDITIKTYESYNAGGEIMESDITRKTGSYVSARMRTWVFNTRDVRSECINRLSSSDLTFNDMAIIRICQNKLPSIGEYAGKSTLTIIFPVLSPTDELLGIRIRTTSETPPPSFLDTLTSLGSAAIILSVVLLSAILGSLLSLLAKKYLIELPIIARYDDLTGYLRRDAFFLAANKAFSIANLTKRPVSVILIDIDYFKQVNDSFGHSIGDDALKFVADTFKKSFRREDIFGRIGGDEFAIVLPNTGLDDAYTIVDKARERVSDTPCETAAGKIRLTVSIGLVEYHIAGEDLSEVMKRADDNLYIAKKTRNATAK